MTREEEYNMKYGNIPEDEIERYKYLMSTIKNKERVQKELQEKLNIIENIKWKEYNYTIYLVPKPTPRPRYTSKGHFMYVKGASDNKKYFRKMLVNTEWSIITTPAIFYCKCYFPIPSSMSNSDKLLAEKGYIHHISTPDFDNLVKTYTDMLKDMILFDDRLIYKGICEKAYSIKPRIEVSIRFMEEHDSDYNRKKIMKTAKIINKIKTI